MTTLVGVNRLNIHHSLDCLVLKQDAVATHNVARHRSHLTTVGRAGCLCHGDAAESHLALVVEARYLHDQQKALLNKGDTLDQLGLDELFGSDWFAKLVSLLGVLEGSLTGTSSHSSCDPGHEDA